MSTQASGNYLTLIPGLLLAGFICALAIWINDAGYLTEIGFSTLTLAIIIGMIIGNTVYPKMAGRAHDGVNFSKSKILRLGIMLYGFRLTLQQIAGVGMTGIVADAIMLTSTFLLAYWVGKYALKMDEDTTILMGSGASICGAAAVLATEPILKAQVSKVTVAVATVVVFGTIGIFLYPQMHAWGIWPFPDPNYGVYIGSSVHEVAQVVAAGRSISPEVADTAVTTKMIRVMMLAPFLLVLAAWLRNRHVASADGQAVEKPSLMKSMPWFAFIFIGVALFNSLHLLPASWVNTIIFIDTILLTMAMAALGLTTHFSAIRLAGPKPIVLGFILMLWLVIFGGLLQWLLASIF